MHLYILLYITLYHGLCGISDMPSQWEGQNVDPHSSHIFQPIIMKLQTKKDIRNTTQTQNLVDVK